MHFEAAFDRDQEEVPRESRTTPRCRRKGMIEISARPTKAVYRRHVGSASRSRTEPLKQLELAVEAVFPAAWMQPIGRSRIAEVDEHLRSHRARR